MAMNWKNASPNTKRLVVLSGVIALVLVATYAVVRFSADPTTTRRVSPVKEMRLEPGDPDKLGQASVIARERTNASKLEDQQQQIELLKQQIARMSKGGTPQTNQSEPAATNTVSADGGRLSTEDQRKLALVAEAQKRSEPRSARRPAPARNLHGDDPEADVPSQREPAGFREYLTAGDAGPVAKTPTQATQAERVRARRVDDQQRLVLPAGSIIEGVLLSGVDAPTATQGRSQPSPVLVKVTGRVRLPNGWETELAGCVIVANAHGELATERAAIRGEQISCVRDDGTILESALPGAFATDKDGKDGLRGTLVSRSGTMLAKSMACGILGALSQIASPRNIPSINLSPTGVTQTERPNADTVLAQAGLAGISSSAQQLQQYYMALAQQSFPIIEVDAGRPVAFVIGGAAVLTSRNAGEVRGADPFKALLPGMQAALRPQPDPLR